MQDEETPGNGRSAEEGDEQRRRITSWHRALKKRMFGYSDDEESIKTESSDSSVESIEENPNEEKEIAKHSSFSDSDEEAAGPEDFIPRPSRCLLCPFVQTGRSGPYLVLNHMHEEHGLDLRGVGRKNWFSRAASPLPPLGDYTRIAVINVLRRAFNKIREGAESDEEAYDTVDRILCSFNAEARIFQRPDEYLLPEDAEDPLLWCGTCRSDLDDFDDESDDEDDPSYFAPPVSAHDSEAFRDAVRRGVEASTQDSNTSLASPPDGRGDQRRTTKRSQLSNKVDRGYFAGYGDLSIHREMVLDSVRTNAYRKFILENAECFRNRVVLDVGCGSGILSLFAAQAGAMKVVAVDASERIANLARQAVRANQKEKVVQVISAKLEDIRLIWRDAHSTHVDVISRSEDLPPGALPFECDVIVSEWMGYCLLYECMAFTVLDARDLYLKPEGFLVPSKALIGAFTADMRKEQAERRGPFSSPVYGLDLSVLHIADVSLFGRLEVRAVTSDCLNGTKSSFSGVDRNPCSPKAQPLCVINLRKVSKRELRGLRCPLKAPQKPAQVKPQKGGILYFANLSDPDQVAASSRPLKGGLSMSTSPMGPQTHWKQTVLHLLDQNGEAMALQATDKQTTLEGFLSINPDPDPRNCRSIVVTLELEASGFQESEEDVASKSQATRVTTRWPKIIRPYYME